MEYDARSSGGSGRSGDGARPKVVLYQQDSNEDEEDTHSELDLDLYDTDEVIDLTKQPQLNPEFTSILGEDGNTSARGIFSSTTSMHQPQRQQLRFQDQQQQLYHNVPYLEPSNSISSSSQQSTRAGRPPPDSFIRTNFTSNNYGDDMATPKDPYDSLATPPGDPPGSRPGVSPESIIPELAEQSFAYKTPLSMRWWIILILFSVSFVAGGIINEANPPTELGYWVLLIGELYLRMINCVTLPIAFCQVIVAVSELVAKNTCKPLLLKTLAVYVGHCFISSWFSIGTAIAFRRLMREHDDLGLRQSYPTFAFKCPNDKYLTVYSNSSLHCTGETIGDNSTFPHLIDLNSVLGIEETVATVDVTEYLVALGNYFMPANAVVSFSSDMAFSCLIIALVLGVAIKKSFRDIPNRSSPLYRLFLHLFGALSSLFDWIQSLTLVAVVLLALGDVLSDPEGGKTITLAKYYCLSCLIVVIGECIIIAPVIFYIWTRNNPYKWLWKNATPIVYSTFLQLSFLTLPIATKTVEQTREIPPAVFGGIYPLLLALNHNAQGIGIPLGLVFVAAFSGCDIEWNTQNVLLIFGLTMIGCMGTTSLTSTQLAYFLTVWRTFCSNEDIPSAVLAIAGISLVIYRACALANTMTSLLLIRVVASFKEAQLHVK